MLIYSFLLGLIQGITEFLPVSSSGHLILLPRILNFADQGLAVDAVLHLATALAIFVYFRKVWWGILLDWRQKNGLLRKIVVASIPAATVGLFFNNLIGTVLRSEWIVVIMLVLVAGLMWYVERNYTEVRKVQNLTNVADHTSRKELNLSWVQAILVGLAQPFALIPGTSRSGITIIAGMWQHLPRAQAAQFSFLLGAPIALGAGLVKGRALIGAGMDELTVVLVAGTVAFVVALTVMHWLLRFLQTGTLKLFVWYRLILAILVVLMILW